MGKNISNKKNNLKIIKGERGTGKILFFFSFPQYKVGRNFPRSDASFAEF
jgi:hypothetical protein